MRLPTLLAALGLVALAAAGHSQPPPSPGSLPPEPTPLGNPQPAPSTTPAPTPPAEQTVDQVLDALERLQAQKAELEKQEQALKDVLAKKLEKQGERVKKVGLKKDAPPKPREGPVTGRPEVTELPGRDSKGQVVPLPPLPPNR